MAPTGASGASAGPRGSGGGGGDDALSADGNPYAVLISPVPMRPEQANDSGIEPPPSPSPSPEVTQETPGKAEPSTRFWVFPIMFAQYFALGLLRPEMPGLLLELWGGSMRSVALYQGITDGIGAVVAFMLVPMIGSFSDTRGRKPALLISAVSAAAPVFVMAAYGWMLSGQLTLVLYALVALVSKLNSYSVALSYVADCSSLAKRSAAFGEVSGVMFLGLTGGPFVSGFLTRGSSLAFAAVLNVLAALYIVFVLPETKPPMVVHSAGSDPAFVVDEKTGLLTGSTASKAYGASASSSSSTLMVPPASPRGRSASASGAGSSSAEPKPPHKKSVLLAFHFLASNPLYALIGLITFLSQLAVFGVGQVYFLYLTEELGFARTDTIHAALIGGVQTSVIMLLGMPWLAKKLHESVLMLVGLIAYAIYALGLALAASTREQAFGIIMFWSLSGLLFPATCSLLSAHTNAEATGLAQGALSAVRSCASGLGPALFAVIFSQMVSIKHAELGVPGPVTYAQDTAYAHILGLTVHYTAVPFVLGALLILVSIVLTLYLPSQRNAQENDALDAAKKAQAEEAVKGAIAVSDSSSSSSSSSNKQSESTAQWPAPVSSSPRSSPRSGAHREQVSVALHHWGKVRSSLHRRRGIVHPAVEGGHQWWDEWQSLGAHMKRRKHEHLHEAGHHYHATAAAAAPHTIKHQHHIAESDEEGPEESIAVAASYAFVLPPKRSSKSRWIWFVSLLVVIVLTLVAVESFGGMFDENAPEAPLAITHGGRHRHGGAAKVQHGASAEPSTATNAGAPNAAKEEQPKPKADSKSKAASKGQVEPEQGQQQQEEGHNAKAVHALSAFEADAANATDVAGAMPGLVRFSNDSIIVMALMGPPGVGKTALSRHLTEAYGLTPLSSGILIRSELARGTAFGESIRATVESGGLVADSTVLRLVSDEIARLKAADPQWPGVILDGFPRTLEQAQMLDAPDSPLPPLSTMVYVHMREDILAERRRGRRTCPKCGATYNLSPIDHDGYFLPARAPKHADQTTCDRDDTPLVQRADDREDVVARRMTAFHNLSLPMAAYYEKQGKLIDIEKKQSAGLVFETIRPQIEQAFQLEQRKEAKAKAKAEAKAAAKAAAKAEAKAEKQRKAEAAKGNKKPVTQATIEVEPTPAAADAPVAAPAESPAPSHDVPSPGFVLSNSSLTVMALMGPPGVGKTALSRHLTAAYGLTPLSSGVLIRSELARGTAFGESIRATVESGGLIEDATVLRLVSDEIARLKAADPQWPGVILDGFPRTLPQAQMLDAPDSPLPPLAVMVYVHMRDDILAERRRGRRTCPKCGASFNLDPIDRDGYFLPARAPKHADQTTCDRDDTPLVQREDDREDIAARRMVAFNNESLPMAAYYAKQGKLIDIEKKQSAGLVFDTIKVQIEAAFTAAQAQASEEAQAAAAKAAAHANKQKDTVKGKKKAAEEAKKKAAAVAAAATATATAASVAA